MNAIRSTMLLVLLLAGCGREAAPVQELPQPAPQPPADLVAELVRDPARLKEVRRLCREARESVSEELCIASALATRQRFMGDGKAKYTPEPVALPGTQDE